MASWITFAAIFEYVVRLTIRGITDAYLFDMHIWIRSSPFVISSLLLLQDQATPNTLRFVNYFDQPCNWYSFVNLSYHSPEIHALTKNYSSVWSAISSSLLFQQPGTFLPLINIFQVGPLSAHFCILLKYILSCIDSYTYEYILIKSHHSVLYLCEVHVNVFIRFLSRCTKNTFIACDKCDGRWWLLEHIHICFGWLTESLKPTSL